MGTHSYIGLEEPDGTLVFVYCHWDGYPAYNGAMLLKHYSNEAKLRELLALGDLASLNQRIHPTEGVAHSYREPEEGVCRFNGRDAGDSPESVLRRYANDRRHMDEEYNYLWSVVERRWYFKEFPYNSWSPLEINQKVQEGLSSGKI
jgi:hypothetical protein